MRVGRAVRLWRGRRGLSQRALARCSGVSARFLAQIETGTGNISLRRLSHLAAALGISVVDLLTTSPQESGQRIALLGLRGAGKSTIGRLLGERLHLPFIELDRLMEKEAGLAVGQIFELHGEGYFRRLERTTLRRFLESGEAAVLATGGGLVTDPDNFLLLRRACRTIWLDARPEDHYNRVLDQGDDRPMADNPRAMSELRGLMASRAPLYRQADLRLDTSAHTIAETVQFIARALERDPS